VVKSWVVVLIALAGCAVWRAEGVGVGNNRAGQPAVIREIRFEAKNSGVNDWGPAVFQVTVTLTNTGVKDTTVQVLTSNCGVLVRVYRTPERTGTPIYDAAAGAECYVPALRKTLAPGKSVELASSADGPAIDLETGRYFLNALITPIGHPRVEVQAGEIDVRR
jgi:hypothetical protein